MRVPAGAKWLMALIWAHKKKKLQHREKKGLLVPPIKLQRAPPPSNGHGTG